ADTENRRVLRFNAPISTGMAASLVFGQPDFFSNATNTGGLSAHSVGRANGVAVDLTGNLYVADFSNSRVLRYSAPFSTGMDADLVLGQSGFTTGSPNRGGAPDARRLYAPAGLSRDGS